MVTTGGKMINLIMIAVSLVMFGNCKKGDSLLNHDELSIPRQNYSGNELRVDGYYYTEANGSLFSPSFFYRNGVFLDAGGSFKDYFEMDSYIVKEFISSTKYKSYRVLWGVFLIEGNSVKFEHWYPSSGGPMKAYVREGLILNDTTFHITKSYRNQNGEKTEVDTENEIYYFRAFSPKPDSTNGFID